MKMIKEFPNYKISKDGTVYSRKKGYRTKTGVWVSKETWKPLKPVLDSTGYYLVTLVKYEDGKRIKKNRFIHRLLGQYYIPNPGRKPHINHINGNKQNNSLSNLEWATEQENTQHAVRTGLMSFEACEKVVHQYTLKGKYLCTYKSDTEAERHTGVAKQNISKVTLGKRNQAGGYLWSRIKVNTLPSVNSKRAVKGVCLVNYDTEKSIQFTKIKEAVNYLQTSNTTFTRYAKQQKLFRNHYIQISYF